MKIKRKSGKTVAIFVGVCAVGLLFYLTSSPASADIGNGKVAYVEDGGTGYSQIFTANQDGSDVQQLTEDAGAGEEAVQPAWSPNGSQIAYTGAVTSVPDSGTDIYKMNADGSGQTNLTNDPTNATNNRPTWNPDGSQIAFASTRTGDFEIWVMNADGSGLVNLTNSPDPELAPVWSPDGTKIAYIHGGNDLYYMNADGSGQTAVGSAQTNQGGFGWTADSQRLWYVFEDFDSYGILVATLDNTTIQVLMDCPFVPTAGALCPNPDSSLFSGTYSPDGTKFIFNGFEIVDPGDTGTWIIGYLIIDADGTNPQLFQSSTFAGGGGVSWQPVDEPDPPTPPAPNPDSRTSSAESRSGLEDTDTLPTAGFGGAAGYGLAAVGYGAYRYGRRRWDIRRKRR